MSLSGIKLWKRSLNAFIFIFNYQAVLVAYGIGVGGARQRILKYRSDLQDSATQQRGLHIQKKLCYVRF